MFQTTTTNDLFETKQNYAVFRLMSTLGHSFMKQIDYRSGQTVAELELLSIYDVSAPFHKLLLTK